MSGRLNSIEDDRQVLVEHEQEQPLDDSYGSNSLTTEDYNPYLGNVFIPAILPAVNTEERPFRSVQLGETEGVHLTEAPADSFNCTYLVFYLLGTTTMTAWNFFVTAEDYWMYKFRNTTLNDTNNSSELTPMQKSFSCDLTLTASISGLVFLILNAIYGHHFSHKTKMFSALSIVLLFFILTTAFVEVNTDSWQEQFFLITLFTVVIINISSAVMSGVIFSLASLFPSKYMTALVSGQALGGIFTALVLILVLAVGAPPNITAFIFFIVGSIVIMCSLIAYAWMMSREYFQYYVHNMEVMSATTHRPATVGASTSSNALVRQQHLQSGVALEPSLVVVFGKIYIYLIAICLLFTTTLSVYPAVTVLMQSEHMGQGHAWNDIYYLPVVNYLLFNTGDYFGRMMAGIIQTPTNVDTLLLFVLARVFYVPVILCSNTNLHYFLPTVVHSDAAFITILTTFAISNGYIANMLMLLVPRICMQHEKEMASSIMIASLNFGLVLGSVLSMAFVQML